MDKKLNLQGNIHLSDINRLEVVDNLGRQYKLKGKLKIELSFQDKGKTLKIYAKPIETR